MVSVGRALGDAEGQIKAVSDTPQIDAERLLLRVLKRAETSWLQAHADEILTAHQASSLENLVQERVAGKPLAYLIGEAGFYGRTFLVNEDVLIPRPETEQLVDTALKVITERRPTVVADVGTGSGVIAITLALELMRAFPSLRRRGGPEGDGVVFIATDISEAALDVARQNAERHGVADMITFVAGDFLGPFDTAQGRLRPDLIVSNPPYVPSSELAKASGSADTAGLTFEPHLALDGGPDGLDFVSVIKQQPIPAVYESLGGTIHRHNC